MSYQVALSFEDGVTRFVSCDGDQTVADASYRSRINIPLDCRDGACGTCKALCESGEYDGGTYIDDALTDDEAEQGYCLPCSMKPNSDLVLQIASTSEVAKTSAATYTGKVTGLDQLSATTVAVTVETPDREELAFLPGQYINVGVPGTEHSRSYSFSNGPDDRSLTFLVKITPGGVMSEYLTGRAAVGDEVSFTGPHGSFFLRESARPILLLAGGTGLAPILSILRKLRAEGTTRPIHLVYGASTDEDVVELDEITRLAEQIETLTWDYCVADSATTADHQGFVMSLIGPEHLYDGDVAVYLCGPPPMVEAVREHLAGEGVEPTGFYYEKFALSGTAAGLEPAEPAPAEPDERTAAEPDEAEPDEVTTAEPAAATPVPEPRRTAPAAGLQSPDARAVAGQEMLPAQELTPLRAEAAPAAETDLVATARSIAGQQIGRTGLDDGKEVRPLDPDGSVTEARDARAVAGQTMLPAGDDITPLHQRVAPEPPTSDSVGDAGSGGYVIGEEHPSVHESDAIFEARQALELGALELTLGRLSTRQIAGYRLLAESTVPYVEGDRFVDAAAYTETNAAFHDYLFTLTGNEHLLQAYHALGVKGHMEETLRRATWCHPQCTQDHLDIVEAFERSDREEARRLVSEHADRSKATTRRAMADADAARRPAWVSPGRFDGKVVVVTGAAQGIGERAARRISAEGGNLVLADRSELVDELARDLTTGGREAIAVTADLETWQGAQDMVRTALARFGRIDVLVNNVGGAIWFKPFTEFSDTEIEAEIKRSLMTTLWCCRAALPSMVEQRTGVIVNVSSAATRGIHRIPYSAAKGGVNAITTALAFEVADHGVRVVATAPGGTDAPPRRVSRGGSELETEQDRDWFQSHIDQTVDSSLLKRYGTLDEQAAALTFLASDEASYITGTVLPVAGGDAG